MTRCRKRELRRRTGSGRLTPAILAKNIGKIYNIAPVRGPRDRRSRSNSFKSSLCSVSSPLAQVENLYPRSALSTIRFDSPSPRRGARAARVSPPLEELRRTLKDAQAWEVRWVALCLLVYHPKGITTSQRPARSAVSHASTA